MKLNYLTTLAAASILTIGGTAVFTHNATASTFSDTATVVAGNPCAGEANPCAAADPCAGEKDPCAAANPCAGKENPCAAVNPCASEANPCAAADPCAANPCAGK